LRNSILGGRVGRLAVAAAAIVVAACMRVSAQNDPQAAVNAAFKISNALNGNPLAETR